MPVANHRRRRTPLSLPPAMLNARLRFAGRRGAALAPSSPRAPAMLLRRGRCVGLMGAQKGSDVPDRLLQVIRGVFPRVEADLGVRRQPYALDSDRVGVRR